MIIDIYRHKILLEKLPYIINIIDDEHKDYLKRILEVSQDKINNYNNKNKLVLNPSKSELGNLRASFKKTINAHYEYKDFISYEVFEKLYEYIDETEFSNDLIQSKILLFRKSSWNKMNPLEKVMSDYLKIQVIKEFESKNKSILIKYKKNETSK
jgi:hypothetical protein